MNDDRLLVQVAFPQEMIDRISGERLCLWHSFTKYRVKPIERSMPPWIHKLDPETVEELFGEFESELLATDFVDYTRKIMLEWSRYCVGEEFGIRVLKEHCLTTVRELTGKIGQSSDPIMSM